MDCTLTGTLRRILLFMDASNSGKPRQCSRHGSEGRAILHHTTNVSPNAPCQLDLACLVRLGFPLFQVPQLRDAVASAADEPLPIRREINGHNEVAMSREGPHTLSRGEIPKHDILVDCCGD